MGWKLGQKVIDVIRNKKQSKNEDVLFNTITRELDELKYVFIPALKTHTETFLKYKNIYKDRDVVVLGSGPTLKKYNGNILKDAIHIGVNHTFTYENVGLDYLFIQDNLSLVDDLNPDMQQRANNYRKNKCKKIYGIHTASSCCITEKDYSDAGAERYYFIDQKMPISEYPMFSADITTRPLNEWSSVIFAALEFALWTHPKNIYLVGCDASKNGHIYTDNKDYFCSFENRLIYGWRQFKEYRDNHYPDVKIYSINPVGLAGLFEDLYTKNYVEKNVILQQKNINILSK